MNISKEMSEAPQSNVGGLPPADGMHKLAGWTLDHDFVDQLARKAEEETGYTATMEVVEFVALAIAERLQDTPAPVPHVVLAPKHNGLRVDYTGLLRSARQGLKREPGTAEMLNQLEEHLSELGRRWYDGDATVVDEFLQLYCIQRVRRDVLTAGTTEGSEG